MDPSAIVVAYGNHPQELVPLVLDAVGIADRLDPNGTIGIKPNLVVAKSADSGATTDPRVVGELIRYLQHHRFNKLVILESAWLGDCTKEAYRVAGYESLSREFGVPLIDLKEDAVRRVAVGKETVAICERALELDHLINVPVLKAHCQTRLTCALKNLKGCIPDAEKRRYHTVGLHRPIALLNKALKTDLVLVDGLIGDLSHEEGGTPVEMNRLIAGTDPVLIDAYAAGLLGYQPSEIDYIQIAGQLGVDSDDLSSAQVLELNQPTVATPLVVPGRVQRLIDRWVDENGACSACLGGLIHALERLDSQPMGLGALETKLAIGQGYLNRSGSGVGIGTCTAGMTRFVDGCPPTAREIIEFLNERC